MDTQLIAAPASNNCTFANLLCGMNYNVTVTRNDGQCGSPPSTPIQIQSGNSQVRMHACLHSNKHTFETDYVSPLAPCDPQSITTVLQCDTNTAMWHGLPVRELMGTLQWQQTGSSTLSFLSLYGDFSCQLTSLPCGMRLNVTVQADGRHLQQQLST